MGVRRHLWAWRSYFVFLLAPILLSPVVIMIGTDESKCAYVILLMATYWISECLPIGVTSLLPVVLFPFFELMSTGDAAGEYMTAIGMISLGALMTALAIEYWNLHKRVALHVLTLVGSEPRWIMLGIIVSTSVLSMWISNIASTAMMVPIAEAILEELRDIDATQDDPALYEDSDGNSFSSNKDDSGNGSKFELIGNQETVKESHANGGEMIPTVEFSQTGEPHDHLKNDKDFQTKPTRLINDPPYPSDHHFDNTPRKPRDHLSNDKDPLTKPTSLNDPPYPSDHHFDNTPRKPRDHLSNDKDPLTKPTSLNDPAYPSDHLSNDKDFQTRQSPRSRPETETSSCPKGNEHYENMAKGLLLSIPYAANCGGIASLTGTIPNLVLKNEVDELYESNGLKSPISFGTWMLFGVPMSIAMVTASWICLQVMFLRCKCGQVLVGLLFVCLVVLWVTRDMGGVAGWAMDFKYSVKGGAAAILICILLFGLPSTLIFLKSYPYTFHPDNDPAFKRIKEMEAGGDSLQSNVLEIRPLLPWKFAVHRYPWGLLLLMEGGLCISTGCRITGLSSWIGNELTSHFRNWNPYAILFIITFISAMTTEVVSNIATTSIVMPILKSLALSTQVHPLKYMLPSCLACSFAFMLPVATPPNAIAFSTGGIKMQDMMTADLVMNILAVPILIGMLTSLGNLVYDFDDIPQIFLNNMTLSS